ncbi:hypothetical protein pipiens_018994 [Culex pipiens pipiens]|uniref:Uncharacterized protein n=1 Tax=Culex pipiens pipiens TaxID=38569 RepID=A0ABD1DXQ4_CULPP
MRRRIAFLVSNHVRMIRFRTKSVTEMFFVNYDTFIVRVFSLLPGEGFDDDVTVAIRDKTGYDVSSFHSYVSYRDLNSTSPATAANFFADFFKSVHSSDAIPPRDHEFEYVPTHYLPLPLPVLNDEETLKALSGVDGAKGPGPDGIPPC